MSKSLVIVESPAKARTIKKYLGPGYEVVASVGHIKDLPKSRMGVDVEQDFEPQYEVIRGKGKVVKELRKACRQADVIYLAPDPDREGEAIAWHVYEEIQRTKKPVHRVMFNEITKRGVTEAIANPLPLNQRRYESQQARRILDRLVGYEISPILWDKVRRGLSAGRVQSVAVRLVTEREHAIRAFDPVEYWVIEAVLDGELPPQFTSKLHRLDGKTAAVHSKEVADGVLADLKGATWQVSSITRRERKRSPSAPFTTSKLQQEASRHFGFTARRTMQVAQRLYEGVEVGDEGLVGLITYMRTDSTRLSDDALEMARTYIADRYGPNEIPDKPVVYRTKKRSQDAHEAVRPTSMEHPPDKLTDVLSPEQVKLYGLIWRRFVASQMKPALYDATTVDIAPTDRITFRATGSVLRYAGFESVYRELKDDDHGEDAPSKLPKLSEGDCLKLEKVTSDQRFTKPPPRFTDATLVKELEEKGIGRPSTYASIIQTILDKGYVEKSKGSRFQPTELGEVVNELLVENFPEILNVEFTAEMESLLDLVEEGDADWKKLLHKFYQPFKQTVETAQVQMRDVKREETPTSIVCERCAATMVIKWGKNGRFLACSSYPDCKNTKEYRATADGKIEIVAEEPAGMDCPTCGGTMVIRHGRFGRFVACARYPECKTTRPLEVGVRCPKCQKGNMVEKRSKRGRTFFSCGTYPDCDFALWDRPVPESCDRCGNAYLVERQTTSRRQANRPLGIVCPECDWVKTPLSALGAAAG